MTLIDANGDFAELFSRSQTDRTATVERMESLLDLLGRPQRRFTAIHVTATNGKTTIARMIDAVLREHGITTGAFTSPHLQDLRERVRIAGAAIDEAALHDGLAAVDAHRDAIAQRHGHAPSFFETMTALAFTYFARESVDTAVIEVGRGGRRDATNVLNAPVAVIGRVALDHPELGDSVAEVAADKAGIIAPGAVVVVGPQADAAAAVIADTAAAQGARLLRTGSELSVRDWQPTTTGQWFHADLPGGTTVPVDLPLVGRHHADNAVQALAAAQAHLGYLDADAAWRALSRFTAPGRCEIVRRRGRAAVWLDGAHNPAAAQALAAALSGIPGSARVVLIAGIMADKDSAGVLDALAPVTHRAVLAPAATGRGESRQRLRELLAGHGIRPYLATGPRDALDKADQLARPQDVVVVTGSLYTVGAARECLGLPAQ